MTILIYGISSFVQTAFCFFFQITALKTMRISKRAKVVLVAITVIVTLVLLFSGSGHRRNSKKYVPRQNRYYECSDRDGSCQYTAYQQHNKSVFHYYTNYDGWHASTEFQGRLDYVGIEKLKLWSVHNSNKHVLPIDCSTIFHSFMYKLYVPPSCRDIIFYNHTFDCTPSRRTGEYDGNKLRLSCNFQPNNYPYVTLSTAAINCMPYDYATSKIYEARKCKFSFILSDVGISVSEVTIHVMHFGFLVCAMPLIFNNNVCVNVIQKVRFIMTSLLPICLFYILPLIFVYINQTALTSIVIIFTIESVCCFSIVMTITLRYRLYYNARKVRKS